MAVNLFKKGDKTDPGSYRGIAFLNTVEQIFCDGLDDRIIGILRGKQSRSSEGQA